MREPIRCPITEDPCRRSSCLGNPRFPECERRAHLLATLFFGIAQNPPSPETERALQMLASNIQKVAIELNTDPQLFADRVISLIKSVMNDLGGDTQ